MVKGDEGSPVKRKILLAAAVAVLAAIVGCGGSDGDREGVDTLAAGAATRIEFERFSLALTEDVSDNGGAELGAGGGGYRIWQFDFPAGGKLFVFRTESEVGLSLQEMVEQVSRVNEESMPQQERIAASIETYKMIRFDEVRAMQLAGRWTGGEKNGDLRCAGVRCGKYFYLIQSLHAEEWDETLATAALSFRCEQ